MKFVRRSVVLTAFTYVLFFAHALAIADDDIGANIPVILAINNKVVDAATTIVEGDEITITGSGFGTRTAESSVRFEVADKTQGQSKNGEITDWLTDKIVVRVPVFALIDEIPGGTTVSIQVSTGHGPKQTDKINTRFQIFSDKVILDMITLKRNGYSDPFILNEFDKKISSGATTRKGGLNTVELVRLKAAGFDDIIVSKFARHRQYLSIGVGAIWLYKTRDLVTSPLLRIFLFPKSYFDKRGSIRERFDLTVGYTEKTSTFVEEKNYVLTGISFELNRSALFNFGLALIPGSQQGEGEQYYLGFTIDSNILKDMGIISKG